MDDVYPLSSLQQGMLFHTLFEAGADVYVSQLSVELEQLDAARFAAAWRSALARHEILRTSFVELDGRWLQRVHALAELPLRVLDWRHVDEPSSALRDLATRERVEGFSLEQAPLLKLLLVRLDDDRYQFVWTHHHVLMDGWSAANLISEVLREYAGESIAKSPRYREHIAYLQQRETRHEESFWRAHLAELETPTLLSAALPTPHEGAGHAELQTSWSVRKTRALSEFAKRERVTLNTLVQGAWALLLQRYTGQATVAFGATVSGRPADLAGAESMLGLFINTVPVIQRAQPDLDVGSYLRALQAYNVALREHEHTALSDLQRWSGTPGQALFDTLLVFENYPVDQALRSSVLKVGRVETVDHTSYALTLEVQVGTQLRLGFGYQRESFDDARIEQLAAQLDHLLEQLMLGADTRLGALPLLDPSTRAEALARSYGAPLVAEPLCLHELVARQASRTPHAIALVHGDERLSYRELDADANRLAHALIARGVEPESLVGICAERSPAQVIAVLAVLKAGAGYLPVDPETPAQRIAELLADTTLVLSDRQLPVASLPLSLRSDDERTPSVATHPDQVAYCIFTSGSTGRPKGVLNPHRGVSNRLAWLRQALPLSGHDKVLLKTPFGFDVSVAEIFWTLSSGATLVIADAGAHRDPAALAALIRAHGITTIDFVPSMLEAFLAELPRCPSLRVVTVGGEALSPELARAFTSAHGAALYNMYGPTEAAIDVAYHRVERHAESTPIGAPLANVGLFVLDAALEPVAQGVTGELYVSGVALARGYRGRAGQTAERFVPSPFASGERLYRTGDLARRREHGLLEFVGRADGQIKLRGYRIELGEIEARLREQPNVRAAAAAVQPTHAGKQLVGYIVGSADEHTLKEALRTLLPSYMVPARVVTLEAMPLTASGKLDRRALPLPDATRQAKGAPESETERVLCEVWREVLGVAEVGIDDDFFELGGDSIISLQVVARARQHGLQLEPKQVFQHHTVRALALVARAAELSIEQGPVQGEAELTPIQQRFFADDVAHPEHFNQALLLRASEPVHAQALHDALQALVAHHDALRLRYQKTERWTQRYADESEITLELCQCTRDELTYVCTRLQKSLDLANGPLLRAALITLDDQTERVLLAIHHLVVDGVSWRVLMEDLEQAYHQRRQGQPIALPARTSSFQTWSSKLRARAEDEAWESELGHWLAPAAKLAKKSEFPCDDARGALTIAQLDQRSFTLGAEQTAQLLREAPHAYRTQVNDLLLTALARSLCRFANRDHAFIELESHGREDCFEGVDLSRSVGWFTSLYPVLLEPARGLGGRELAASIKAVKEQLRAVPENGLGHGALATYGSELARRKLQALPRPRVTFNYLGQVDQSQRDHALFVLADESVGESQHADTPLANWLTVNGEVARGVLTLSFGYSRAMYRAETIERLVADVEHELEALIGHCVYTATPTATPSDFPLATLTQAQLDAFPLPLADVEDVYPLSSMQQGMLFHTLYSSDGALYVNQQTLRVDGLDVPRFIESWDAVVARHAILRTAFVRAKEQKNWLQVVLRGVASCVREVEGDHDELARKELRAFELEQAPLQRVLLVRDGASHRLIWTFHHLLLDGWSAAKLIEEVLARYLGKATPTQGGRFRDYIAWLAERDARALQAFWTPQLQRLETPTSLAGSVAKRPATGPGRVALTWSERDTELLRRFAQRERVTVNTLVQAAWVLLLQRYTGQRTVAFGATVAGRPASLPGAEHMLGLFINTLPVIQAPHGAQTVGAFLRTLQEHNLALREVEHSPLHDLQRWAGRPGQALFDTLLVFENYPVDRVLRAESGGALRFSEIVNHERTNFPLAIEASSEGQLSLGFGYDGAHFDESQVHAIAHQLDRLLRELTVSAERTLASVPMTDTLPRAPSTPVGIAARSMHALVEAQVRRTPQAIAVSSAEERLSYAELNARANQCARALRRLGVGPDRMVGLCVERGVQRVVGMLAILKAGGAYVPLDPDAPRERLSYQIGDSDITLLVTQRSLRDGFADAPLATWCIDDASSERRDDLPALTRPQHLAYCIYTSGSTGKPKGVLLHHEGLLNHMMWMRESFPVDARDCVLQRTSFGFDASVWEFWLPLMVGARMHIASTDVARDPALLLAEIEQQNVTVLQLVPQLLDVLLRMPDARVTLARLRHLFAGGEALPLALVRELATLRPGLLKNLYGPTEATIDASSWVCVDEPEQSTAPLGRPIANTQALVLGPSLEVLPAGVVGELWLSGTGLARGYHRRAGLTGDRFVPNPYGAPGDRLYRTGDLARMRDDGVLEYAGRADHQIKIRGHRVELGEIEARLSEHESVREAVVIAREQGSGKQLVGYVVGEADEQALRAWLRATLPEHMVPAHLVKLDKLPLTYNGKVDRRALPAPERAQAEYVAPSSAQGRVLAEIWQSVLGVERVGLADDFFELGGDSVLAMRVIAEVTERLHINVPLRSLFDARSLSDFERALHEQGESFARVGE
ncbi:MAG: amino acid adenylation domain-containing protein [Polyangiales bacterium]